MRSHRHHQYLHPILLREIGQGGEVFYHRAFDGIAAVVIVALEEGTTNAFAAVDFAGAENDGAAGSRR